MRRLSWLVGLLAVVASACGGGDEEVGNNRGRTAEAAGQGGSIGNLPGVAGQGGDTTTGSGGSTVTGGGGGAQGFVLRAAGLGRQQMASPAGAADKTPSVRFGGVSPLGRVCNGAFCVTGDLR